MLLGGFVVGMALLVQLSSIVILGWSVCCLCCGIGIVGVCQCHCLLGVSVIAIGLC